MKRVLLSKRKWHIDRCVVLLKSLAIKWKLSLNLLKPEWMVPAPHHCVLPFCHIGSIRNGCHVYSNYHHRCCNEHLKRISQTSLELRHYNSASWWNYGACLGELNSVNNLNFPLWSCFLVMARYMVWSYVVVSLHMCLCAWWVVAEVFFPTDTYLWLNYHANSKSDQSVFCNALLRDWLMHLCQYITHRKLLAWLCQYWCGFTYP